MGARPRIRSDFGSAAPDRDGARLPELPKPQQICMAA
jgi:hypothetical protein